MGANRGEWDEFHSRKFLLKFKVSKINPNIRIFKCVSSSSPNLTWRDVQHIIAHSARAAPGGVWLKQGHWLQNKARFNISKVYGFGLMDAGKMAMLASKWKEVPEQIKCEIEGSDKDMWVSIFSFLFKFFFDVPLSEAETYIFTCADLTGFLRHRAVPIGLNEQEMSILLVNHWNELSENWDFWKVVRWCLPVLSFQWAIISASLISENILAPLSSPCHSLKLLTDVCLYGDYCKICV